MRYKPQRIDLRGLPDKWVTLLTRIHNSIPPVYRLVFSSPEAARVAYNRMCAARENNTWMKMEIIKKTNVVYVVKSIAIQETTIEGF